MTDLVAAAYRGILSRDPDPAGLKTWSERLARDGPELLFSGLIQSAEFRRRFLIREAQHKAEQARWMTNYLVHLQIGPALHPARLDLIRRVVPAGNKVLDLGGASQRPEGALLQMGYRHAKDLTIVDLPLNTRFKPGVDVRTEFRHENTTVRYAYHSMADLSFYPDNSFDLVWSGQTYEHINEEEGRDLFPQIARVLKSGGIFAMDTPNRTVTRITVGDEEWIHAEHKIEYEYEDFVRRFAGQGLDLIDAKGIVNMPQSVQHGISVLGELDHAAVNDSPQTSYCFYLAYQKP